LTNTQPNEEYQVDRLPNLSALRAFEATVRHKSVSRAANEIGVTDGAVSRAVRDMEASLGFDLFTRSNRAIVPTAVAHVLASEVHNGLERIAAAIAVARRMSLADRPLVLSCEPTFLMRWLIPRLSQLQDAIGAARDVHLVSSGGPVAFVRDNIDLAIRRADFDIDDAVIAEPFLDEFVGPVCAPTLVGSVTADAVIKGVILHTKTRPNAWSNWAQQSGVTLVPEHEHRFEHFYLSLQAAVAGTGVAIGPAALVADDIESGVLVAPHGFAADGTQYVLMANRANLDIPIFNAVLNWLRAAMPTRFGVGAPTLA
jgi:LysR family transcriptional regulator, glycine cleavage system transcriptional activator